MPVAGPSLVCRILFVPSTVMIVGRGGPSRRAEACGCGQAAFRVKLAKWIGTVEIEPRPSGRSGGRSPNCSDEPLRTAPGCYRPLRSRTTSCLDIFSRCRLHRPSRGACGANSPQPQRSTVLTLCPLPCIGSLARRRLIGCADRKSKALRRAELHSRTRPRSKC